MRRIVPYLLAATFTTFGAVTSAHASTIGYSSTFDPADVLFNSGGGACAGTNNETNVADTVSGMSSGACDTLTFSHQLVGYTNPTDTLLNATLSLYFHDDTDPS